jgi:inosine/xanthosine triphosphatase
MPTSCPRGILSRFIRALKYDVRRKRRSPLSAPAVPQLGNISVRKSVGFAGWNFHTSIPVCPRSEIFLYTVAVSHMNQIKIAVGSTRRPKLNAVTDALQCFGRLLGNGGQFDVAGFDVESGVGHTPLSHQELMRGARQRADALVRLAKQSNESWHYFVGLEGGLDVVNEERERRVFLESWAYVTDGSLGHYGRSGAVELPRSLAHEVLDNGVELSVAIDRFAGAVGIRDAQGAWGVLSADLISRQEAFRVAVIAAFAPFYNRKMYRDSAAAG